MSKRNLILSTLVFAIMVVAGAWWLWLRPATLTQKPPSLATGAAAPNFSLQDPDGNTISLSGLKGNPVLVVFWTSSCASCAHDLDLVEKVYAENHPKGLEVLGINVTGQDSAEAAVTFSNVHELTFPLLFDADGQAFKVYQVTHLPSLFFIDRNGKLTSFISEDPGVEADYQRRAQEILKQ
jgi:cytochrome c biogenesis protein CcmG, thiol:disulfide interchange protein DsbE